MAVGKHSERVWSVAVAGDGRRVVSGGEEGAVILWDFEDSTWESKVLGRHAGEVQCVTIRKDR